MPEIIKYQDQVYYSASYYRGRDTTGFFIIREDGNSPQKQEAIELLFITLTASTIGPTFFKSTRKLARKNFFLFYGDIKY